MDEKNKMENDFVQLARLAVNEQWDDVRLFLARLVRNYRQSCPDLANKVNEFLKENPARRARTLRDSMRFSSNGAAHLPIDRDSQLTLLNLFENIEVDEPLLAERTRCEIEQLLLERRNINSLIEAGLTPTRSAIFEGPPGVGKTLTARWVARQLNKPLLVLDLATVMSSYLGRTGSNLRSAIEYAKNSDVVLLLDEIDAIAKRRSDDTDIGELKRLVTVVLQEVDAWPDTSLLLAATNHPELIDPALWRRFDTTVHFALPDAQSARMAVRRFFGEDLDAFSNWVEILSLSMKGESFSAIEKAVQKFRRSLVLGAANPDELALSFLLERISSLSHPQRIQLAVQMANCTDLSQHKISSLTGVARDTIRKHASGRMAEGGR